MNLITIIPYIAILLANVFYFFMSDFDQHTNWFQIFLFNFGIMVLAGIFIIIHVNILLHQWLVVESDKELVKGQPGKLTQKQIIQKRVKYFLNLKNFAEDLFIPGNQEFLLKVYLGMAFFRWFQSLFPGILGGLLFGLFYQYTKPIYQKYIKFYAKKYLIKLIQKMPKYHKIKVIKSKQENLFNATKNQ